MTGGGASTGSNTINFTNIIRNYSYIFPKRSGLLFRCVSGLGPASNNNAELGDLHFNGSVVHYGKCNGSIIQPREVPISNHVGVINVRLCGDVITPDDEGIYTCTMTNSNMVKESLKVGVYMIGRGKYLETTVVFIGISEVYVYSSEKILLIMNVYHM